jgi:hypothetical protein
VLHRFANRVCNDTIVISWTSEQRLTDGTLASEARTPRELRAADFSRGLGGPARETALRSRERNRLGKPQRDLRAKVRLYVRASPATIALGRNAFAVLRSVRIRVSTRTYRWLAFWLHVNEELIEHTSWSIMQLRVRQLVGETRRIALPRRMPLTNPSGAPEVAMPHHSL